MKKNILSLMAALLIGGSAMAAPVSVSDAKQKALSFVRQQAAKVNNPRKAKAMQNAQLTEANAFGNELHIFNVGGNNGFVIVSGDDRTEEILGYVDCGNFDINTIPANMKAWLQGYANQIKSLGNSEVKKAPRRADYANVEPLLTTNWDQRNDYNDMLFFDSPEMLAAAGADADDVYTGCAATSMAQALYQAAQQYKKKHGVWPSNPTTVIPSYKVSSSGKINNGKDMPALDPIVFDWEHMLNNYARKYATPTEQEIKAVAMLMAYCGRAMHMEYGTTSSDAAFVYMPFRMAAYFGIQPYVKNMDRTYYTTEKWENLIYNELANGRAVPYTGVSGPSTSDAGHAFVLDGYKDGLWHINWGWGQAEAINDAHYNGYFSLSVMQPDKSGTAHVSGGALDSEYKYLQQATIGVSFDPVDGVANTCYTHIGGGRSYSTYTTEVTYLNYNVEGGVFTLDGAWAIDNGNGNYTILKKDYENRLFNKRTTNDYGEYGDLVNYTQRINQLPVEGIADGTYTVLHVSSLPGENNWVADDGTDLMNFTITVSNGKITDVVCHPVAISTTSLKVKNLEFVGDMEAKKDNIVRVTIENTGDDFFGNLALYYNTTTTPTSSKRYVQLATLKPGETTHEFTVNLPKGEYNLWFYAWATDGSARDYFDSGRKMYIGYGADANKIQAGNLQFDGQTGSQLEVKSVNGVLANEVTGSFDITNSSGHIYNNTYYVAVEYGSGYSKKTYALAELPVSVEEGTHTIPFNLGAVSGLESGKTYKVRLYSKNGDEEVDVTTKDMTLQPYFRYWLADGTIKEAKEPTSYYTEGKTMDPDAKANAVAIDLKGIKEDYIRMTDNPNCLFYLADGQKLDSEFSKANKVLNGAAEKITIDGSYSFYAPEGFTVEEATYTRKFANGNNNDGKGWETIILPFKVNAVKNGNKNLQWFKSSTDKRKHFWVMEFTDAKDNDLVFDYAQNFEANTPYLISVPGNKWGDNWDLTNKDITFRGVNVTVPASVLEPITYSGKSFVGMLAATTVNGWILNDEGTNFEQKEAEVKGFNAYITTEAAAPTMRIIIADATGIINVETEDAPEASSAIYNLNGMRVNKAQKGVYIQNGKKYVVK